MFHFYLIVFSLVQKCLFYLGANGNCTEPTLQCNCDANLPMWSEDTGVISEKSILPIKRFHYDALKNDLQQARISIGSLKCSGIPIRHPVKITDEIGCKMVEWTKKGLKMTLNYENNHECRVVWRNYNKVGATMKVDYFKVSKMFSVSQLS